MLFKKTMRWFAGALLIIAGIALLAYDFVIPGAIGLIVGLLILPWSRPHIHLPHLLHQEEKKEKEKESVEAQE